MRKYYVPILAIIIAVIIPIIFYSDLPEQMAVHWSFDGETDRYMSKQFAAFILPAMMILITLLMALMPKIDPKSSNYSKFSKSYNLVKNVLIIFFLMIQILIIAYNVGYSIHVNIVFPLFVSGLLIILGSVMPRFKHNYFIGIRTPWALHDEENWNKTQRFGGRVFVIIGLLIIPITFLTGTLRLTLFVGIPLAGVILISAYSYSISKKK